MGEIAILHAPDSRALSCRIAAELAAEGHSVLRRESGAPTGDAHSEVAAHADAVLVVWSPDIATHPSMIDGARRALARRALVPARVHDVDPPASFAHLWPIDLDGWNGETDDPRWQFVRDEVALAMRRSELTLARPLPKAERVARVELGQLKPQVPALKALPQLPSMVREAPLRFFAPLAAGVAALSIAVGVFAAQQAVQSAAQKSALAPQVAPPVIAYVKPIDPPGGAKEDQPQTGESESVAVPAPPDAKLAEGPDTAAAATESEAPEQAIAAAASSGDDLSEIETPAAVAQTLTIPQAGASAASETVAPASPEPATHSGEAPVAPLVVAMVEPPKPAPDDYKGVVFRDCVECPDMTELPTLINAEGAAVVRPIAISRKEITLDEWRACAQAGACRPLPAADGAGKRPAINVSYRDAAAFADWLSQKTGLSYRLPTAAEWAYAAGSASAVSPAEANLSGGPWGAPLPAGSFKPSAHGLYDMYGNVWEWTSDCAQSPSGEGAGGCAARILKGGAFDVSVAGDAVPTAERSETARAPDAGFRIVRDAR